MHTQNLGKTRTKISAIGLGGMPLSLKGRPSEAEAIAVIHRALELGVTLIDTADSYCIDESDKHHNERLIAKALQSYSGNTDKIYIATKGGLMRPRGDWTCNGDPNHLRRTIRESFQALGGEKPIPLWQFHAPDENYPVEVSMKAVKEAVDEGYIRFVGVSNFSVEEIKKARSVVEVVSVQNQYNPWHRKPERDGVLEYCEREGLTFFPWSPLGGSSRVRQLSKVPALAELASEKNVSVYQLILAWLRAKSPCIVPIPGASRIQSIEDSVASLELHLSSHEMKKVDSIPVA